MYLISIRSYLIYSISAQIKAKIIAKILQQMAQLVHGRSIIKVNTVFQNLNKSYKTFSFFLKFPITFLKDI